MSKGRDICRAQSVGESSAASVEPLVGEQQERKLGLESEESSKEFIH